MDGCKASKHMVAENGKCSKPAFNYKQTSPLCVWDYPLRVLTLYLVLEAPYIGSRNALHYVLGIFSVNKVRPCYHKVCLINKTAVP